MRFVTPTRILLTLAYLLVGFALFAPAAAAGYVVQVGSLILISLALRPVCLVSLHGRSIR